MLKATDSIGMMGNLQIEALTLRKGADVKE
jgi:hypothetical protein